ncbi:flagellar basal body L-ring protein FlgH [Tibeticola sediminis]|uniref:flagellar basal body L-ring protein FlgH n=1 Tax=Tibeticola sediminis TaxID=1917811 RepID=UPI000F53B670|nr:flagellar basal body L-ring protein FlgH [Tibeticola sediminis]
MSTTTSETRLNLAPRARVLGRGVRGATRGDRLFRSPAVGWVVLACAFTLGGCVSPPRLEAQAPIQPLPSPAEPAPLDARAAANGAIWQSNTNIALFEDGRAHRVGDLITILVKENANATKASNTAVKQSDDVSAGLKSLFGKPVTLGGGYSPDIGMSSSTKFSGDGSTAQSNSFTTTLQATVTRVWPNGNLEISGQKEVTLNGGREFIRVAGVVRAQDVSPQNTVLSTQIANARVEYSGNGDVYAAAKVPWLTSFFLSLWPF